MTQETIGRYIVRNTIGEGAMGTVYRAHDPIIEREVAIKTIRIDRLADESARETFKARFFREAKIGGSLQDPNIVTLYDLGEHESNPFIVMELVKGDLLASHMEPGKPLPLDMFLSVTSQIASALETAHERGIIHRDIKPQNIMMTEKGVVKILDFGIAKMDGSDMTQTGQFIGTPKYSSPEQIAAKKVDSRSDIFSLGVVAHELMTGYNPFAGSSLNSILFKIAHGEPTLSRCSPEIVVDHTRLHAIFRKALQKDPTARFQRATEFSQALQEVFEEGDLSEEETVLSSNLAYDSPDGDTTKVFSKVEKTQSADSYRAKLEKEIQDANLREARILQLKNRFQSALREGNKAECESIIRNLRTEKADVVSEEKGLDILVSKLDADERERLREDQEQKRRQEIEEFRRRFGECLKIGDHAAARQCIAEMEKRNAAANKEKKQLDQSIEREREQKRLAAVEEKRKQFTEAVAAKDLEKARGLLADLKKEAVETNREQAAFAEIEQHFLEERKRLEERARAIQAAIEKAIQNKDTAEAERGIKALKEIGYPCQDQERALQDLARNLKDEARKRDTLIKRRRKQFRAAIKQKDMGLARQHLDALATIDVDLAPEERMLSDLAGKLAETERKQKERKVKNLEKRLNKAVKARNVQKANQIISELGGLGLDTTHYRSSLAAVKVVRPPERKKRPVALWGTLAAAAALIVVVWVAIPTIDSITSRPSKKHTDVDRETGTINNSPIPGKDKSPTDKAPNKPSSGERDNSLKDASGTDNQDKLGNQTNIGSLEGQTKNLVAKEDVISSKTTPDIPNQNNDPEEANGDEIGSTKEKVADNNKISLKESTVDKTEETPGIEFTSLGKNPAENVKKALPEKTPENKGNRTLKKDNSLAEGSRSGDRQKPSIDLTPPPEKETRLIEPEKKETERPRPIDLSFLKSFNHQPEKSYKLTSDTVSIKFDMKGIPRDHIRNAAIVWRIGRRDEYITLPMTLSGSGFTIEIPTKDLKQGKMEYYFTLNMTDGKSHPLNDKGEPFTTKLKNIRAQGF